MVICRVVTPKDKERNPSLLTKQNVQGLGLYVGLSHLRQGKKSKHPGGHSKSTFVEEGMGSLKSEQNKREGEGDPGKCVRLLFFKKNA